MKRKKLVEKKEKEVSPWLAAASPPAVQTSDTISATVAPDDHRRHHYRHHIHIHHLHQPQDHMVFIIITIIAQVTIILIICHQHHPRPFRHYSFSITIIIVYSLNNAQFSENIFGCFCLYLVC